MPNGPFIVPHIRQHRKLDMIHLPFLVINESSYAFKSILKSHCPPFYVLLQHYKDKNMTDEWFCYSAMEKLE